MSQQSSGQDPSEQYASDQYATGQYPSERYQSARYASQYASAGHPSSGGYPSSAQYGSRLGYSAREANGRGQYLHESQSSYPYGVGAEYGLAQPYSPQTNTMAILSLVFAFVFSPLGVVFGFVGLSQIKRTGEQGKGLALAGLITSSVFVLLFVCYVLLMFLVIASETTA